MPPRRLTVDGAWLQTIAPLRYLLSITSAITPRIQASETERYPAGEDLQHFVVEPASQMLALVRVRKPMSWPVSAAGNGIDARPAGIT